jgi:glycerol dehydrogenase
MRTTTIFPARYVQGPGALHALAEETQRYGERGAVIVDPFVLDNIYDEYREGIEGTLDVQVLRFGGESSDEEVERLIGEINGDRIEFVAGIGGGKTLDTAKLVAEKLHVSTLIVPTLASTDAPCSALSVVYTPDGAFKRYVFFPKNPDLVLVDTDVIIGAGRRLLVAGMGDALSTWFEAEACRRSGAPNMTGQPGSMTAFHLARLCYDTLLEHGESSLEALDAGTSSPALEKIIEANTLLSGLGFESGGLASCHAIHNGLTELHETHDYYHGEKVAIGVLASLFLRERSAELIDEVYTFCENVGLPTKLEDIGLGDADEEMLRRVAERATEEVETIHNEPVEITVERVIEAIQLADREGRRRQTELVQG